MGLTLTGTVKFARALDVSEHKDGSRMLLAIDISDELGTTYACQMWGDDDQQASLLGSVGQMRRQPVQVQIVGYSVRMRKFKDGTEKPQANFVMSNVVFLSQQQHTAQSA